MIERVIERWHQHMRSELEGGLDELLDDDVVFYSPIVYTPQAGKAITKLYLQAAGATLPGDEPSSATPDDATAGFATRRRFSPATPPCSSSRPRWTAST